MPSLAHTIARVHRVVLLLDASDDPDLAWYAEATRLCLEGAPWPAAVGLANGWRDALRFKLQSDALHAIVISSPATTKRSLASRIEAQLRAYETTTWHADQRAARRPGGSRGLLFDYLSAGGPCSAERIRKLLSGSPGSLR